MSIIKVTNLPDIDTESATGNEYLILTDETNSYKMSFDSILQYLTADVISGSHSLNTNIETVVDTFDSLTIRSAEYIISYENSSSNLYGSIKLMVYHDGSTADYVAYAELGDSALVFNTEFNGTNIELKITQAVNTNTEIRFVRIGTNLNPYTPSTGGGSALEIEDSGNSLTTNATKINFTGPGVSVSEPLDDEITVNISGGGGAVAPEELVYCPGYTCVFVDSDTFRVDGLDVTNLFRPGRRLQLTIDSNTYYAVIDSSSFSTDSTVNVTMESGSITAGLTDVCLTSSETSWSPIVEDPFAGTSINSIVSGMIGATNYIIIVGDFGKIAYSSDQGVSWTTVTSGTTENLNSVAYSPSEEQFVAVGNNSTYLYTTNIDSWTIDSTSLQTNVPVTSDGDVYKVLWYPPESTWLIWRNTDFSNTQRIYTSNITDGNSWIDIPTTYVNQGFKPATIGVYSSGSWIMEGYSDNFAYFTSSADSVASNLETNYGATVTGITKPDEFSTYNYLSVYINGDSGFIYNANSIYNDTTTFSEPLNSVAYSPLHGRAVVVGNSSQIGYINSANFNATYQVTAVTNGFAPLANIKDVHWNDNDGLFIAVADNGQICRSTNGTI